MGAARHLGVPGRGGEPAVLQVHRVSRLADSQLQLYQVHDWQAREVAAVVGQGRRREHVIARAVVDTLEADGVAVTGEKLGLMRTAFLAKATLQPTPQLLGQPDDDDWCVYRARIRPDATVAFPLIQQFLDRLNDPRAFAAWWWGVYSGRNKGRQMIYLWDKRGEGAKSVILKMLGSPVRRPDLRQLPDQRVAGGRLHIVGVRQQEAGDHRRLQGQLYPASRRAEGTQRR